MTVGEDRRISWFSPGEPLFYLFTPRSFIRPGFNFLMRSFTYDIFSGAVNEDPVWEDVAERLDAACEKMKERAEQIPGRYFVFCVQTGVVVFAIDTSNGQNKRKAASPSGPQYLR